MEENKKYTITELAALFGVHIQTLRKYEQDFELLIPRDENETIIKLKEEGLSTKAINKMLGRSVDVSEQREQALEVVTMDKLTGQDIQILLKKTLTDALDEQANSLKQEFVRQIEELKQNLQEEHKKEMEKHFSQQASENEKLRNFIIQDRQEKDKPGFWTRIFKGK